MIDLASGKALKRVIQDRDSNPDYKETNSFMQNEGGKILAALTLFSGIMIVVKSAFDLFKRNNDRQAYRHDHQERRDGKY